MSFIAAEVKKGKFTLVDHDGIGPRELVFHFNPTTLKDSHPPTWSATKIPGQSLPVYQYGGSGERVVSFSLYLDGDRGRMHRNSATSGRRNPLAAVLNNAGLASGPANSILSQSFARFGGGKAISFIRASSRHAAGSLEAPLIPDPAFSINPRMRKSSSYAPDDPVGYSIQEELNFLRRLSYPGTQGNSSTPPRRVIFNLGAAIQGMEAICEVGDFDITYFTKDMEPVRATVPIKLKEFSVQPTFRSSVITKTR